jgi:shikimate kinase
MIVLMGYMGCGKTTVAKTLSTLLNKESYDLDSFIEKQESKSITGIFAEKGEIYFRKRERQILENILEENPDIILSLGGGTPCFGDNMQLIKKNTSNVFYLKSSIETLTDRLLNDKETRPLIKHLKSKSDLEQFVRKHLFERNFYYLQAHHIIDIDGKSPETISNEIALLL